MCGCAVASMFNTPLKRALQILRMLALCVWREGMVVRAGRPRVEGAGDGGEKGKLPA